MSIRIFVLSIVTLLLESSTALAGESFSLFDELKQYQPIANLAEVNLGRGVDTLSLSLQSGLRHQCIGDAETGSFDNLEGSNLSGYLSTIDSQKSLSETMNRAISGSVGIGVFNAAASVSLMKQSTFSYTHAYALLWVKKTYLPRNMKKPQLIGDAAKIATAIEFFENCGDSFISSYAPGAFAVGLVDCSTTEVTDRTTAANELGKLTGSIPIGAANATFGGSFKATLDRVEKETNSTCSLTFDAGGGKGQIDTDKTKFIQSLAAYVQGGEFKDAIPLSVSTKSYNEAVFPESKLLKRIAMATVNAMPDVVNYQARIGFRVIDIEALETLMVITPDMSEFDKLVAQRSRLRSEIAEIEKFAEACASDPFATWTSRCGMPQ